MDAHRVAGLEFGHLALGGDAGHLGLLDLLDQVH
jgi:hypothetical protein